MWQNDEEVKRELEIFLSLALNYPILKAWGYSFRNPIGCVLQNWEEVDEVVNFLKIFQQKTEASDSISLTNYKKMLTDTNSDFVFLYCTDFGRLKNHIQVSISAAETGIIGSEPCNTIPFVFFCPAIPEEVKEAFFLYEPEANWKCLRRDNDYAEKIISFAEGKLPMVQDRIDYCKGRTPVETSLMAAACFFFPRYKELAENAEDELTKSLCACQRLCEKNEEAQEDEGLTDVFRGLIYAFLQEDNAPAVYYPSRLPGDAGAEKILFDSAFLYIPEGVFGKIVSPLKKVASEPTIKKALKRSGVLVCSREKTFTTKVLTSNVYGIMARERMLKFCLQLLDIAGDIPLREILESRKGE